MTVAFLAAPSAPVREPVRIGRLADWYSPRAKEPLKRHLT